MTDPRVEPLPAEEWDDDVRRALAVMLPEDRRNPDGAGPALSTLARHPDLAHAFLRFSVYLTYRSSLPDRVRETVILRTAHRCQCAYEWHHHVQMSQEAGLSDADIAAIQKGVAPGKLDQLVLTAVDELDEHSVISEGTWAQLCDYLDERQRMDLVFTAGGYRALAMAFNTFGVLP